MLPGRKYDLGDLLDALFRRRWYLLVPFLTVAIATIVVTLRMPNRYESEVRIQLVPAGVSDRFLPSPVTSTLGERLPSITSMVLTTERLARIANDLGLSKASGRSLPPDPITRLRSNLRIRVAPQDSFILTYSDADPRAAAAVAERLGAAFIDENRRRSESVAGAATQFLDAQLDDARSRLESNEQQLAEFNRQNAGELPSQLQANLQMLQAAQAQLQSVRESLDRDRDEAQALDQRIEEARATESAPAGDGRGAPSAAAPAPVSASAQQLEAAVQELHDLEARLKPEHPDVVRQKRRIVELQAAAKAEPSAAQPQTPAHAPATASPVRDNRVVAPLQTARANLARQITGREAEEKRLRDQIDDYRRHIDATPGHETELTELMRDYSTLKESYAKLLAKKEDAQVSANLQDNEIGEQFVITQAATTPSRPASPNRMQLNVVGTLGGLLLGVGLAAFVEYRDTSIRTGQDLAVILGAPLLAAVPLMQSASDRRRTRSKKGVWLVATATATVAIAVIVWHFSH